MRFPGLVRAREWRVAPADSTDEILRAFNGERGRVAVFDRPLPSRIQEGPTCGLCALSIVARALRDAGVLPEDVNDESDIQQLVERARDMKVSQGGEMFDAESLAVVARDHYSLNAEVVHSPSARIVWERLAQGQLALIAYDRDNNNSPRQTGGQNAHWAIIRGVAVVSPHDELEVCVDAIVGSKPTDSDTLWFICQQTKSRWTAAWRADVLLASNAQLARCVDAGYVIPEDLTKTLASRIIFLSSQ